MLVRLLYASRAVPGLDHEELQSILRASRLGNARLGITGALSFTQGVFMQTLEGGRGAVNRLYHRIVADPRHRELELPGYAEIAARRFASWSMGEVPMARLNPALVLKHSESATLDPFVVSGSASAALFEELIATAAIVGQS
jgi:hypothetical protein